MHVPGVLARLTLGCAMGVLAQSCESPMSPGPLAAGTWGGDHAGLTVTDSGAHLELGCAFGDITQPITIDGAGRFAVDGLFVQERPGPISSQDPDFKAARYSGQVMMRATMTLTVTLVESNTAVGSFVLIRGSEPKVQKCV